MRAYERLINYAKVWTTSDEESGTVPSAAREFDLAKLLVKEMKAMGISEAWADEHCYVYGILPASKGYEDRKVLAFIAHIDTAPDFCGEHVNPQILKDYDGGDVRLGDSGKVLLTEQFPHLCSLKGRTLITTDGTTLLGADDKAGIAEIMTMAEELLGSGEPHGKIVLCFTPDEEIGGGADLLDIQGIGADYGYTLDGGPENEISYENFHACSAEFDVKGFNIHPGDAKNKMVNAALVAMEINGMLPSGETPRDTEGYEGFYHLTDMSGNVEAAKLSYIIRDHSAEVFDSRKKTLCHIEKLINEKYGEGTAALQIQEQYRNMEEVIRPCMHLIDHAKEAMKEAGVQPLVEPIRGGTDGARLSYRGLPCPNLGTGGYAFHGPYEHITAEGMDTAVQIILGIIRKYV